MDAAHQDTSRQTSHKVISGFDYYDRQWQEESSQDTGKAAWTNRLIRDIRPWIKRSHGECSYYLAQVLSGHWCLGS